MLKSKGFYKGVNFGGWLSQCDYSKDRLDNFITENDIAIVSEWGADHVRIPFDYNILQNPDGSFIEEGFERLRKAIVICRKYGMNTILDLHKTAGFSFDYYGENESGFFDSPEYQEKFYQLWEELAKRFGRDPEHIAFELLNEVTDKSFIDNWNRIADTCVERIRQYAPETLIFIGSYNNNAADAVYALNPPHDENIVYNMHCYDPLKFTHQGAYWTDAINKEDRFTFEESGCNEEYFENLFASAINKAKENNVPLYCGEYGVIDVVSPEDTVKWLKCIHSVFEKHGIGRAIWSYKEMDFGISDDRLDNVRNDILQLL